MDISIIKSAISLKLNEIFTNPKVYTEKEINIAESGYPAFFVETGDISKGKDPILKDWYDYSFIIKFLISSDLSSVSNINEYLEPIGNRFLNYFTGINIDGRPIMLNKHKKKWSNQNGKGLFEFTIRLYEYYKKLKQ